MENRKAIWKSFKRFLNFLPFSIGLFILIGFLVIKLFYPGEIVEVINEAEKNSNYSPPPKGYRTTDNVSKKQEVNEYDYTIGHYDRTKPAPPDEDQRILEDDSSHYKTGSSGPPDYGHIPPPPSLPVSYDEPRVVKANKSNNIDIKPAKKAGRKSNKKKKLEQLNEINTGAKSDLTPGRIAYEMPDVMDVDKPHLVTVAITTSMDNLILYKGLDPKNLKDEEIFVTRVVKVKLIETSGKNFDIIELATEKQTVDDSTNTIWRWNVTPRHGGSYSLMIRATIQIPPDSEKDKTVFEKTVSVNAEYLHETKNFFSAYWQFILSVVVLPLIVWGYKLFKARSKKKVIDENMYV